ncbi:hypothetical protein V2I01_35780 [Micromonospora sp. BRA006-A]|nr:hypothetical protein [Micromonospora sp. BRA006-A]
MVVAMVAGMVLLGPLWQVGGSLLDGAAVLARPDVAALVMATNMAAGMAAWMWYRGTAGPPPRRCRRPCTCRSCCCSRPGGPGGSGTTRCCSAVTC